ncbi:MAG: class I SAM-dependent methyltransferase [Alphaproteobacteria bacterium]|nr:class I SAM-dependent methyltransferase [Alphaproteobacteria bacterium]
MPFPAKFKAGLMVSALSLIAATAVTATGPIETAVSAPERPTSETQWDGKRHPIAVLDFMGLKPGMTVWDHGSGRGYYTAIMSRTVGPDGKVYAHNSNRFWPNIKDTVEPRHKALGNVETFVGNITDFDGHAGEFDMIFIGLLFHHLHYSPETGNGMPESSKAYWAKAMEMLKPGGVIAIVEHQAPDGTPRAESAAWHRTSLQDAITDLTAAGFEYVGSSDALANPDDPQNIPFRDLATGRYSSQRFVAKFRKPS